MRFFKYFIRKRRIRKPVRKNGGRKKYLEHKEAARELVRGRLEYFNTQYGYKIGRVSIKNTRSRWGSCSSKGNLNFNYRIALLPKHLVDYVVVHELCHLGQFNHSPAFWNLVARTIPDYVTRREELRKVHMGKMAGRNVEVI